MGTRRRRAAHNLGKQALLLRARYPDGHVQLCPPALWFTCELTPSMLSRTYTVELRYRTGRHPRVRVLSPALNGRPHESLPHVFGDGTLCLYREGEWSGSMLLANTVIPWAAEWLFYYELWVPGGEWYGGGEWPPTRQLGCAPNRCAEP